MKRSFGKPLIVSMVLVILLLFVNAFMAYFDLRGVQDSERWVAHTHEVIAELEVALSTLKDAETGQRGYLLTGEAKYLEPYDQALTTIHDTLDHLKKLTSDNSEHALPVVALEKAIQARLDELPKPIDLLQNAPNQAAGYEAVRQYILSDEGKKRMDAVRVMVDDLKRMEVDLLRKREAASESRLQSAGMALFIGTALSLAIVGLTFHLVNRNLSLRQQAAESIQSERERLHTTLTSIGDAVIVTDVEGRVTLLNQIAQNLTGWQTDAIGQPLKDVFRIVNEETRQPVESPVVRVLQKGVVAGLANHTILIARDSSEVPIDDSAAPIRDAKGRIVGVVLVFRDVTDRTKWDNATRESEARYHRQVDFQQAVMDNMGEGLYAVDDHGVVTYINPIGERLLGYGAGELLGRKMHETTHYQHPDGSPFPLEECAGFQVLRQGKVLRDFDDFFIRKDGSFFPVRYSSAPLRAGEKNIGLVVVFRDMTERKEAEDALRESTERLKFTLAAAKMAAWEWDLQSGISQRPAAILSLLDLQDNADLRFDDLIHPEDRTRVESSTQQALQGQIPYDVEFRVVSPMGVHWIKDKGRLVYDSKGRPVLLTGVSVDITERKMAEESMQDADRRKDHFLAMLAHELRNPLAPIRNAVQVLQMLATADEKTEWAKEVIDRQVKHMTRLVDDLLDVSRITSGKINILKEPVDVMSLVANAVETSKPLIELRNHKLEIDCPKEAGRVNADPTRLAQVIGNLLNNAAKYTDEGGQIWLSVKKEGEEVVVRVRDNGIGIPPEQVPHIFNLFTQVDSTLERTQGGLGIGLTLVRSLVEMHGGKVQAFSKGRGQGSEFAVRLRLLPEAKPTIGRRTEGSTMPELTSTPCRLLVIDDNKDSAESLALLLQLQGHEVHTAYDGPSGLQNAKQLLPRLIFLDLGLPGMSGYEVAEQLKKSPELCDVPLVALTGFGSEEDLKRSSEAGFAAHLVKPLDPSSLEKVISELV